MYRTNLFFWDNAQAIPEMCHKNWHYAITGNKYVFFIYGIYPIKMKFSPFLPSIIDNAFTTY